jgi:hypothetical protein
MKEHWIIKKMNDTDQNTSEESIADIRIVGLNRDKTRKTKGSDSIYQIYLELSEAPPRAWRNIFEGEWKVLNPAQPHLWQAASIDRGFLLIHCPLQEIAAHLPALETAVAATNKTYIEYVQELATEKEHREDLWKQERKAVDDIAGALHFEQTRQG